MPFSDVKILRHLGSGIIGFTVFLILVFGLWFWSNASSMPAQMSASLNIQRQVASVQSPTVQPEPAQTALNGASGQLTKPDPKLETISVSCKNPHHVIRRSIASLVRIKIHRCHGTTARVNGSHIVNLSNGNEGTLFKLENGEITSDYIHLANGQNQLSIKVQTRGGRIYASNLTIYRSPHASRPSGS